MSDDRGEPHAGGSTPAAPKRPEGDFVLPDGADQPLRGAGSSKGGKPAKAGKPGKPGRVRASEQSRDPKPPRGKRPQRAKPIAFWAGIVMITVGALMLGWVGWQMYGTNIVSSRKQAEVTEQLQDQWQEGGQKLAPKYISEESASALIRIPKFGSTYVMPVLEGTSDTALSKGYAHFSGTANPGEVGNYALAAHRITHGEPLRRMPELRPGDRILVETAEATYAYELDTDPRRLVVPFTASWVLDPVPQNPDGGPAPAPQPGQSLITLTTCSELFHTDNRMIAFGHLVSATPKPGLGT